MTPVPHPDDIREVAAAASKRLMAVAVALQTLTAPIDLSRKDNPK